MFMFRRECIVSFGGRIHVHLYGTGVLVIILCCLFVSGGFVANCVKNYRYIRLGRCMYSSTFLGGEVS